MSKQLERLAEFEKESPELIIMENVECFFHVLTHVQNGRDISAPVAVVRS